MKARTLLFWAASDSLSSANLSAARLLTVFFISPDIRRRKKIRGLKLETGSSSTCPGKKF